MASPDVPQGELVNTSKSSLRPSMFKRWLQTRGKKNNGDPSSNNPHPLSEMSHYPRPADPQSCSQSPMHVNKGPSIMAEGKRERVGVLARKMDVVSNVVVADGHESPDTKGSSSLECFRSYSSHITA